MLKIILNTTTEEGIFNDDGNLFQSELPLNCKHFGQKMFLDHKYVSPDSILYCNYGSHDFILVEPDHYGTSI